MARNAYEIRLELQQLAENRLRDRFFEAKERFRYLDEQGVDAGEYPIFPSDEEIDALTSKLIATMAGER